MGIRLDEAGGFKDLMEHEYHKVSLVSYLKDGHVVNIAIECEDCGEVLIDFDAPNTLECTCIHSTFGGIHDLTCPRWSIR